MEISKIQLYLSTIISLCQATPFIFEDSIQYCNYQLTNWPNKRFETTSKTFHVKFQALQINFKLCGTFGIEDECPEGTVACLEKTGSKQKLGTNFNLVNDNQLISSSRNKSETCSLIVHLQSTEPQPLYYKTEANCSFHIKMKLDPITISKCSITILNRYLDLSPLQGSYKVLSDDRNFSIAICDQETACQQENVNACEFKDGNITPLSETSSLKLLYDDTKLVFRGETHVGTNGKIGKRFEVVLKCNWDKKTIQSGDLKYVKPQTQGKKYLFELDTSYGCIKRPISCILNDDTYVYDLSKINKGHPGIWNTYGPHSTFFIQLCGPIDLTGRRSSCKDSYAQVCESVSGRDINRGSILSHLQLNSETTGIRATIDTGSQCSSGNKKPQYRRSFIDFSCDNIDHGPEFLKYDDCDTYFQWKTPHACPELNSSSCAHIHPEFPSCTFKTENRYYDLNALNSTKTLKDNQNSTNAELKFNICGPIDDSDTKCLRDVSVILKNLDQPDKRHSLISLGKFHHSILENDDLVLKYITGAYCHSSDYKSSIRIHCSDKEEEPVLLKKETCNYEFLWKTPHGCHKSEIFEDKDKTTCSFTDTERNQSLDFDHLTPIELDIDEDRLIFNLCEGSYVNCTGKDDCSNEQLSTPNVTLLTGATTIHFILQKDCSLPDSFNSIAFNFVCDKIKNNDHFGSWTLIDCNLKVDYFTNAVCSFWSNSPVNEETEKNEESPVGKKEELPVENIVDCHIKSPDTERELNVHDLPNIFFQNKCPESSVFNQSFRYVKLLYPSKDICRPIPTKNMSYEVYLMCSNEAHISYKNDNCLQNFHFTLPEYCDFFRAEEKSSVPIIIGSVFGCLSLLCIIIIGLFVWKRRNGFSMIRGGSGFISVYERDSQS